MEPGQIHYQYIEKTYEEIYVLNQNNHSDTKLCRNRENGQLVVKKQVSFTQGEIYRQLKKLRHPNLITIYDVCDRQEDSLVIMEFVSGQTIKEWLKVKHIFSLQEAMLYMDQLLDALQTIHQYHIIHRDIKPDNILISTDGVIKLLDFGIARIPKESQTMDTCILGTVGYASPEQFGFQQTNFPADIYAAGVLFNEMLTGSMPGEQLVADEYLKRIILKCIHIDPQRRYESISIMRGELRRYSNKYRFKNEEILIDRSIWPGFRTGVMWRMIVAVIGYICLGIFSAVFGLSMAITESVWELLDTLYFFIAIWLAYFILTNFNRWDRKVFIIKHLPFIVRVIVRVVAAVIVLSSWDTIFNY